jgi:hypothetical protein
VTKERIRRSLLERVSLEGVCRIFDVSMTWLLEFMEKTFVSLPEDLNATVLVENDDFEVIVFRCVLARIDEFSLENPPKILVI